MEKAIVFNRHDLVNDFGEQLAKHFNFEESSIHESESGESWSFTFVFDFPQVDFADLEWWREMHTFDSHGCEGNPGGICSRQRMSWADGPNGGTRVTLNRSFVWDI